MNLLRSLILILFSFLLLKCTEPGENTEQASAEITSEFDGNEPYLIILGIAQDAGYPQAACKKDCCNAYWSGEEKARHPACLGLVDPANDQYWMFEATPDFKIQLAAVQNEMVAQDAMPEGIFLTHAHIGHYTGLMQLGHEVMGASEIPVYAMPRMYSFLENNGPWSQLVDFRNIALEPLETELQVPLNEHLSVYPFLVPHRDEYSETVGYRIDGPNRSVLFIPDIDKWEKWDRDIKEELAQVDLALVDGTFYQNGELGNRDMSQIPHPFVAESMELFQDLPASEKAKVCFIHFNHTNPLIFSEDARQEVEDQGFLVAEEGMRIVL